MPNLHWFFTDFSPESHLLEPVIIQDPVLWHHLKTVMRYRPGQLLVVVNQSVAMPYECELISLDAKQVVVKPLRTLPPKSKPCDMVAAVSLLKGHRWDWLLQKLTEIGVSRIVPLLSVRSVIDVKHPESKIERWVQILKQASEQSEQTTIPEIVPPIPLSDFLNALQADEGIIKLVATERGGEPLVTQLQVHGKKPSILFAIGPEGGWAEEELGQFQSAGFLPTSLGDTIFRSETAAVYIASVIRYVASTAI